MANPHHDKKGRFTGPGGAKAAAEHYGIKDPAEFGGWSGKTELHKDNPHHETLTKLGFKYAGSVPIGSRDGSYGIHHTYVKDHHRIGVDGPEYRGWEHSRNDASGRSHTGYGDAELEKHLKRALKRLDATSRKTLRAQAEDYKEEHGEYPPWAFDKKGNKLSIEEGLNAAMAISKADAENDRNHRFYHATLRRRDGTSLEARRNGKTKTWKTRPTHFQIPFKHGFKGTGYINHDNAHEWHLFDRGSLEKLAGVKPGTELEVLHDKLIDLGHEEHAAAIAREYKRDDKGRFAALAIEQTILPTYPVLSVDKDTGHMLVEKEIIAPGQYWYTDESTGLPRKLEVTPELTKYWHEQGTKMLEYGLQVPVPYEHDFNAHPMTPKEKLVNNAGEIKEYRLKDIYDHQRGHVKDVLFGVVDVQDPDVKHKIGHNIRWTSPWINSFTDGDGRHWNNVISHLALTTRPRITKQQPFESFTAALSMADDVVFGREYTRDEAGRFALSKKAHEASTEVFNQHHKEGHNEWSKNQATKLAPHLAVVQNPHSSQTQLQKAHMTIGLAHDLMGRHSNGELQRKHYEAADLHAKAAEQYNPLSRIERGVRAVGGTVAHGAKAAVGAAKQYGSEVASGAKNVAGHVVNVARAGTAAAKGGWRAARLAARAGGLAARGVGGAIRAGRTVAAGARHVGGAIAQGARAVGRGVLHLKKKIGLSIEELEDGDFPDNFCLSRAGRLIEAGPYLLPEYPVAFSMWSNTPLINVAFAADGKPPPHETEENEAPSEEGEDNEPVPGIPDDPNALPGNNDPMADQPGDIGMEELLCDLLQALGVPMPDESNEHEFQRHLYEAVMSKIKELTSKGMSGDKSNMPDQNQPPGANPHTSQPNPLIQQEQQPMYMSLDEINKLPKAEREIALGVLEHAKKAGSAIAHGARRVGSAISHGAGVAKRAGGAIAHRVRKSIPGVKRAYYKGKAKAKSVIGKAVKAVHFAKELHRVGKRAQALRTVHETEGAFSNDGEENKDLDTALTELGSLLEQYKTDYGVEYGSDEDIDEYDDNDYEETDETENNEEEQRAPEMFMSLDEINKLPRAEREIALGVMEHIRKAGGAVAGAARRVGGAIARGAGAVGGAVAHRVRKAMPGVKRGLYKAKAKAKSAIGSAMGKVKSLFGKNKAAKSPIATEHHGVVNVDSLRAYQANLSIGFSTEDQNELDTALTELDSLLTQYKTDYGVEYGSDEDVDDDYDDEEEETEEQGAPEMFMSLDDINKLPDPMRGVAMAMYAENQKLRSAVAASKQITDSLRDAKLKEANIHRLSRVATISRFSPRVKADLTAMLAQPDMALSMGDGGNVVDPMHATLATLEKALGDMPRLLTSESAALNMQPQPTDESMMTDARSDELSDALARMVGAPPKRVG